MICVVWCIHYIVLFRVLNILCFMLLFLYQCLLLCFNITVLCVRDLPCSIELDMYVCLYIEIHEKNLRNTVGHANLINASVKSTWHTTLFYVLSVSSLSLYLYCSINRLFHVNTIFWISTNTPIQSIIPSLRDYSWYTQQDDTGHSKCNQCECKQAGSELCRCHLAEKKTASTARGVG